MKGRHSAAKLAYLADLKDLVADATDRVDFITFAKEVRRGL